MISRGQAHAIAESAVLARGIGTGVRAVCLLAEITTRPPWMYNGPDPSRCWIAYVETSTPHIIQSSTVVFMNMEDGTVLACGSANDEG
jgi:hypothetical protein